MLTPLARFCEQILLDLPTDPHMARRGTEHWEFYYEGMMIRFFIHGTSFLYITTALAELKDAGQDVYAYMLSNPVSPYQLGIYDNSVFISYRVHLSDLNESRQHEILDNGIRALAVMAGKTADHLVLDFGCIRSE